MVMPLPTLGELKGKLSYDKETGIFRWLGFKPKSRQWQPIAGGKNSGGYIHIKVDGRLHKAHRMAWLFSYGEWPMHDIDHINGNPSDNRIANLRDVSTRVNCMNSKARVDNPEGLRGIRFYRGKWIAECCNNFLGSFATKDGAICAYVKAAKKEFGDTEFVRHPLSQQMKEYI